MAYENLNRTDDAIEHYKMALRLNPNSAESYNNLGNALKNKGMLGDAMECYRKALHLRPEYPEACNNMGRIFQGQGKLDDAIEYYKKALHLKPDFAPAYNELGLIALENEGDYTKSLEHLQNAVRVDSTYAIAYYNMAGILANAGKFKKAAEAYSQYLMYSDSQDDTEDVISRIKILLSTESKR